MNPLGLWPLGNGREVMASIAAFANRFDADFEEMGARGVELPFELKKAAEDLSNLTNDIAYNGGVLAHWGVGNEPTARARRAAVRIILQAASELAGAFDTESPEAPGPNDPRFHEDGQTTPEFWRKCHDSLFDVVHYAQCVMDGEEMNLFCSIEDAVSIRRAFALAPEALAVVTSGFQESLDENAEWARQRLAAVIAPLPPEDEPKAEGGEA